MKEVTYMPTKDLIATLRVNAMHCAYTQEACNRLETEYTEPFVIAGKCHRILLNDCKKPATDPDQETLYYVTANDGEEYALMCIPDNPHAMRLGSVKIAVKDVDSYDGDGEGRHMATIVEVLETN